MNNGIISIGNHNHNTVYQTIHFHTLTKELEILSQNSQEKDILEEAIECSKEKKHDKLIKCLKKLSIESYHLVKSLALTTLQAYIEKYVI